MEFLTGYAIFHWIATWANPFADLCFRRLVILLLGSVLLALLPHQPAAVYAEVALLWVGALWAYPQALQLLCLGRRAVAT